MTDQAIRERPILFTPPMAGKSHDGRKTQTRRVVKLYIPQDAIEAFVWFAGSLRGAPNGCAEDGLYVRTRRGLRFIGACQFGKPGDRLWVRESFRIFFARDDCRIEYRAGGVREFDPVEMQERGKGEALADLACIDNPTPGIAEEFQERSPRHWRPNIHMPRAACRSVLEILSVRVERVRDISEADAIAEGFDKPSRAIGNTSRGETARDAFLDTFFRINKRAHADSNPWVWVIGFRLLPMEAAP